MKILRQGDLLFREIQDLPDNLKIVNSPIIARGEHTGHSHRLLERTANQFEVLEDLAGNKYLNINQPTDLVHEEHKKITIDKGLYFVVNEREYNYFEEAVNRVQD